MSLETYTETELATIREDLRAMCVSQIVIEYVDSCCRQAYAMGQMEGLKEGRAISIAKEQRRMLAASGEEC